MRRFAVDDVVPASDRLPEVPLRQHFPDALTIAGDPELAVVPHHGVHPLLAAVGLAFADHRPLVLSPDAVWLTIAQGVAQHVRLHARALRERLVRHPGHKALTARVRALPSTPAEWAAVIDQLHGLRAAEIGDGRARLFACEFSTSTPIDRLASQIVLFDATSGAPHDLALVAGVSAICQDADGGSPDRRAPGRAAPQARVLTSPCPAAILPGHKRGRPARPSHDQPMPDRHAKAKGSALLGEPSHRTSLGNAPGAWAAVALLVRSL